MKIFSVTSLGFFHNIPLLETLKQFIIYSEEELTNREEGREGGSRDYKGTREKGKRGGQRKGEGRGGRDACRLRSKQEK